MALNVLEPFHPPYVLCFCLEADAPKNSYWIVCPTNWRLPGSLSPILPLKESESDSHILLFGYMSMSYSFFGPPQFGSPCREKVQTFHHNGAPVQSLRLNSFSFSFSLIILSTTLTSSIQNTAYLVSTKLDQPNYVLWLAQCLWLAQANFSTLALGRNPIGTHFAQQGILWFFITKKALNGLDCIFMIVWWITCLTQSRHNIHLATSVASSFCLNSVNPRFSRQSLFCSS